MQSIIWDTSVYIINFRKGISWENAKTDSLILSSVVAAELITGYIGNPYALKTFENYASYALANNRTLTPSFADWHSTGIIIGKMISKRPDLKNKRALLFNDCLIATSSRQINAKVVTANIRDFELIRKYINFQVNYITC